ncbi:related to Tyrosine-protein phosphatase CDC14 [Saccharomycodes ludwigii]|uniref:Tyrosine-protein phosphatase CDC14 n=1 Tax=Saccharomycodes ludwigii TaxID=36035 RepID=A0A376B2N1_9ASCO|nr:related to Tyrosine-protein phosphatase CDC14 [Saccharomycodes ludwigii]
MTKKIFLDNTIEFLKGRVYLGAYDYIPENTDDITFFTMEDELFYNSFHLDFGPFHIGHLYRFAVRLHDLLTRKENQGKAVVFYSSTSTRQRANAACLLCCYMILIQSWAPHQVLQPLAQVDPPFMPFRDAGYSNADFEISIQNICYGCWRAKECGLVDLQKFDLDSYEYYERVENGDLNILTPNFIAFASPREDDSNIMSTRINRGFRKVLDAFHKTNVKLVVRLNSHLYNKQHFENIGIKHLDMIFEDGTCPDLSIVTNFIGCVETIINNFENSNSTNNKNGDEDELQPKIAIHCKAGLGRTGCLIGAYLIYKHGFTAEECIGFLRFIRPGMVVGPQQHWLYLNQQTFREWKYTMRLGLEPSDLIGGLYPLITLDEYRIQRKRLQHQSQIQSNTSNSLIINENKENTSAYDLSGILVPPETASPTRSLKHGVPLRSPGQPRKGHGSNTIEDINESPSSHRHHMNNSHHHHMNKNNNSHNISNDRTIEGNTDNDISMGNSRRNVTPIDENDMRRIYVAKQQQRKSMLINNTTRNVSGGSVRKTSGSKKF